jgi:hypothetical protein
MATTASRRSSSSSKRRIVVALWVVAAAGAILLVLGPRYLWRKGSGNPVGAYIQSVDGLEQQMKVPLSRLLTAYNGFSGLTTTPRERTRLAAADRTLRRFQTRLVALPAPHAATELRLLLIRLVGDEDGVAREIDELASFAPRFRGLLAGAALADTRLTRTLAGVKPPKAHVVRGTAKQIAAARAAFAVAARGVETDEAMAVDGYDAALADTLRGLAALRPPPVLAPAYASEVRALRATVTSGAALARGFRQGNTKDAPELLRRFTEASRISGSLGAQRAELAAVKAYNSRVREIRAAQGRVQSELDRLRRGA